MLISNQYITLIPIEFVRTFIHHSFTSFMFHIHEFSNTINDAKDCYHDATFIKIKIQSANPKLK